MKIFFYNQANYPVKMKINSFKYLLQPDQVQEIIINEKRVQFSVVVADEDDSQKFAALKLKNTLKKLFLNVSCTFMLDNVSNGDTLYVQNYIYEFKDNALLLPFAYHYLTVSHNTEKLKPFDCNSINARSVKKLYLLFAILGDGGFDFLLNLFSVVFQMRRIHKLCQPKKVFEIVCKDYQT